MEKPYNIWDIISDIRETCYDLKVYLKEKGLSDHLKEIEKDIHDAQEIGQCDNCNYWTDLGEMNEQSECEACNTLDDES
jgi:hypothetical protein